MTNTEYRTRKDKHSVTGGYAIAALAELADGRAYPAEVNTEQARKWAQTALDQMVAAGYIEPQDMERVNGKCSWCGDPMPVPERPQGGGRTKLFCSPAHKQAAHRSGDLLPKTAE